MLQTRGIDLTREIECMKALVYILSFLMLFSCSEKSSHLANTFWSLCSEVETDFDKTVQIVEKDLESNISAISYYMNKGSNSQKIRACYIMGRIQLEEGDIAGAIITLYDATRLAPEHSGDYRFIGNIYKLLSESLGKSVKASNDYARLADLYLEFPVTDKTAVFDIDSSFIAPAVIALASHSSRLLNRAEREKHNLQYTIFFIIISILILFLWLITYLRYRQRIIIKEREESEEMLEAASRQIEQLKNNVYSLQDDYIRSHKPQIELLENLLLSYKKSGDAETFRKKASRILNTSSEDFESQMELESKINKRMDFIMKKLRQDFQCFSEDDFRFISFSLLGFDASTVALLTGMQSKGAVYTRKSRIKKTIFALDSEHRNTYFRFIK